MKEVAAGHIAAQVVKLNGRPLATLMKDRPTVVMPREPRADCATVADGRWRYGGAKPGQRGKMGAGRVEGKYSRAASMHDRSLGSLNRIPG